MYSINMSRIIFHVDMDAFFASIEIAHHPELRNKPVIVGGSPHSRGVVSTCSYEARAFGVRSAMPLFEAYQRCPKGIFLDGNHELYRQYSQHIMQILYYYTHRVETVSIDEAYLDLTSAADQFGGAFRLGQILRQKIFDQTQLTCSVGIAVNKLIAKVASSLAKPNGLYEVPAGQEETFLASLPIQCLPGVGTKTQRLLNHDHIKTIGDLQALNLDFLIQRYGARGYHFYLASHGQDNRKVEWEEQAPKSIGAETTFETDQSDRPFLKNTLQTLTEKAWKRLRSHKMRTKRVCLKLRYNNFKTTTHTQTLSNHKIDFETILTALNTLFDKNYNGQLPLRLLGVSLEQLTDGYWQPTFWD